MKLIEIDSYRYFDPVFEGVRVILNQIGETYTPEYISGISGSAFKIAAGCPSRPTCVCDFWPAEFFRYMGYEVREYACEDADGHDISGKMIESVKEQIDKGHPALVWHAFRDEEWDVVCGYDEETKQFIGKGNCHADYVKNPWDRPKTSNVYGFGAVIPGKKVSDFNAREAEMDSLKRAVSHARKETAEDELYKSEGIQGYKNWAAMYAAPGADRGVADSYCYDTYSSVRKAAVIYLRGLGDKYGGEAAAYLKNAAADFEIEIGELEKARPYISWDSPWGVDEERSKMLAPILTEAAAAYENGIESIEKALPFLTL
jgi:hypothetical protein